LVARGASEGKVVEAMAPAVCLAAQMLYRRVVIPPLAWGVREIEPSAAVTASAALQKKQQGSDRALSWPS
jgi:hypothetical protein